MSHSNQSNPLNRRRFLRGMALSAGGAMLAACGAAPQTGSPTSAPAAATSAPAAATSAPDTSGSKTKVTVMHTRNELSEEQQKQFETDNPDIQIEFIQEDMTRFFAMYAAGNPPDLARVAAADVPQLLSRDLLLDLTPYFESSKVIKIDDLAPANNYYKANSPTEIGQGKIYGMTKDWSPDFTLYAYTKAFAEAGIPVPATDKPLTYAELGELARKLTTREGDRTTRWGFGYFNDFPDRIMMNILAENGKRLYSDDFSTLNLVNNPEAREVAQYFFDLAKEGATPSPLNPSPSWPGDDFTKGNFGLVQYGYWFSAMAESDVTKGDVVMLPAPTWTGKRLNPTMTAVGMVMSRTSKAPDAAWRVFEWFNAGQPALDRFSSGWGVPSLTSKFDMLPTTTPFQQQANTILKAELPYAETPIMFNPYVGGLAFGKSWAKNLESALRDQITFDDMLKNIETEINTAIQDGKDLIG